MCSVQWIYDYQGMVVLAANQVWWTWEVEDTFVKVKKGDKMGMKNYSKKLHSQLDELVVQVRKKQLFSLSLAVLFYLSLFAAPLLLCCHPAFKTRKLTTGLTACGVLQK